MNWPEAFFYSIVVVCIAALISGTLNRRSAANTVLLQANAVKDFLGKREGGSPPLGQDPDDYT